MYSQIVKVVPVTKQGNEDQETVQYGILDRERNLIMSGFTTYSEAEDELHYRQEEDDKIGDFGGEA